MLKKKEVFVDESKTVTISVFEDEAIDENSEIAIGNGSIMGARDNQEDCQGVYIDGDRELAIGIVCDGMGGMECGELASNISVKYFCEELANLSNEDDIRMKLKTIIEYIDDIVYRLTDEEGNYLNSGTTLAGVVFYHSQVYWISVGDSKIFLIRGGQLNCLTTEHNYNYLKVLNEDNDDFYISENIRDDALISYIGKGDIQYIDYNEEDFYLEKGDRFVLVSDGVTKTLTEEELLELSIDNENNTSRFAEKVLEEIASKASKYQDNATIVALSYYGKQVEVENEINKLQ